MFHYSGSGDNKKQVKNKEKRKKKGRGFSVRDIVVVSHGYEGSISQFTSSWKSVQCFRSEKVTVKRVESMLSYLYSLVLVLSGWGGGFDVFQKQLPKYKRGSGLLIAEVPCGARPLWQREKQTGES